MIYRKIDAVKKYSFVHVSCLTNTDVKNNVVMTVVSQKLSMYTGGVHAEYKIIVQSSASATL